MKHNNNMQKVDLQYPGFATEPNKSSLNTIFLQNQDLADDSLNFIRGWFWHMHVKMPGHKKYTPGIPTFATILMYVQGNCDFGEDINTSTESKLNESHYRIPFTDELIDIVSNGFVVNGTKVYVRVKAFICDSAARAFVKCM